MSERQAALRNEGNIILAAMLEDLRATVQRLEASNARKDAAIRRYLDLNSDCDHVDGEPDVCPGIEKVGSPCHWCELRAALDIPNP